MSPLAWCVVPPTAGPHAGLPAIGPPTSAAQIAEFRARVLFDAGRRPSFRTGAGQFDDADPLDRYAFQIALREDGALVGCIRTNPTSSSPPSSMATALGPARLEQVLASLGVAQDECWDGGRWAVDPARQRAAIGGALACAAMAVARHLGGRRLVGVAGVRGGQAERLVSLGATYVAACPSVEARAWDDVLRVVAFDLDDVHADVSARVAAAARLLQEAWPERVRPPLGDAPAARAPPWRSRGKRQRDARPAK